MRVWGAFKSVSDGYTYACQVPVRFFHSQEDAVLFTLENPIPTNEEYNDWAIEGFEVFDTAGVEKIDMEAL